MPNEITITKAKLLKGDKIEVGFSKKSDKESKAAECEEKHRTPAHQDLVNAFKALNVHAALIGEFVPLVNVPDIFQPDQAVIDKFHVSGISISKPGTDDEGVIITAQKTLNTGKSMGFNTPLQRFNDVSEGKYQYLNELQDATENVIKEMTLYIGGKFAPEPQQEIPGINGEENEEPGTNE